LTDRNTQAINKQVLPLVLLEEERETEEEKIIIGRFSKMPLDCGTPARNGANPDNLRSLPNYRNKPQPYLSELIWIMIYLFGLIIPNQLREKYKTKLLQVFPQGYLRFRDGHFLGDHIPYSPVSLNLSFIKGVFRQREVNKSNQHNWSEPNDRER